MGNSNWTISSVLDWTTDYFKRHNIEDNRKEAEFLLASVLRYKRLELWLKKDEVIPRNKLSIFKDFIKQRSLRKPVSYILGEHEFMGFTFKVNEHTLIPRPETELLVEETINLINQHNAKTVVDMGTGSGNIAISLSKLTPIDTVFAIDISLDALSVCWENIHLHSQVSKVIPKQGDMFDALASESLEHKVDIIVSNPPYIAHDEFCDLSDEVNHEPHVALYGGQEGLAYYQKLIEEGRKYLNSKGFFVFELNAHKSTTIIHLIQKNGYHIHKIVKDYAGLDRVLIASQ